MGEHHNEHANISMSNITMMLMFRLASSLGEGEYLSVGTESDQEEDYLIPLQVPLHHYLIPLQIHFYHFVIKIVRYQPSL